MLKRYKSFMKDLKNLSRLLYWAQVASDVSLVLSTITLLSFLGIFIYLILQEEYPSVYPSFLFLGTTFFAAGVHPFISRKQLWKLNLKYIVDFICVFGFTITLVVIIRPNPVLTAWPCSIIWSIAYVVLYVVSIIVSNYISHTFDDLFSEEE